MKVQSDSLASSKWLAGIQEILLVSERAKLVNIKVANLVLRWLGFPTSYGFLNRRLVTFTVI